jgi:Tol biopolymer transport system component/cytosine/adenosine deaminase-related metal-dependent hydrolase
MSLAGGHMRSPRKHNQLAWGILALSLLPLLIVQSRSRRGSSLELEFHEGTDMEASPSPDGRFFALQLWSQIWILDTSNGRARLLTDVFSRPDEHISPRWSPDGASIVFSSLRSDGGLFVVPVSGGKPRQLTFHELDSQPSWAPDGRTIVFCGAGCGGLWTVPAQGGSPQKINSEAEEAQSPAWSPDGRWIACVWRGGIAVLASNGGSVRQVTKGPADQAPSWSPDGRQIFFLSPSTGELQVWSVPVEGGKPVQWTDEHDLSAYAPQWIPHKNLLSYVAGGKIRTLDTKSGTRGTIPFSARITLARKSYKQISPALPAPGQRLPVRSTCSPVSSPDGQLIAFSALGDLWLRHADGKVEQLTSGSEDDADPTWSPDGTQLAYVSNRSGDYQVWAFDLAGRTRRQVTAAAGDALTPIWQPSGENIVFVRSSWWQQTLCIIPSAGGEQRTVVPAGAERITPLGWFPEDHSLVIEQLARDSKTRILKSTINRVRLDGSAVSWTTDLPDQVDSAALSTQGNMLAYVSNGELCIQNLLSEKGSEQRLIQGPAFFPAWSPDRALLFVSSGKLMRVDSRTGEQSSLPVQLSYEIPRISESLLLHNARLLTPEPREGLWDVLLRDGLIRSLRPAGTQSAPADRIMDIEGRTVIPGLINLHEHLYRGHPMEGFLYWGNTSVASAGDEGHWSIAQQEAIYSGRREGPRLFPSGGFIAPTHVKAIPENLRVKTAEQLRRHMDHLIGLGITQVKASPSDRREPWVEAECIEVAHRHGLPVLSHFLRPASVAAGLDRKEHALYFGLNERLFPSFAQDTIEILRKADISISSTIVTYFIGSSEGQIRFKAALAQADVADFLLPSHAERLRKSAEGPSSANRTALMDRFIQVYLANIMAAHKAGIRIIAGTDVFFLPHGLHWDLELLVRAGLSPLEALRTATSNAAVALGLEGRLGCIAPAAAADLIVLEADPLKDIRNTQKIHAIIQGGRIIDRPALLKAAKRG